MKNRGKFIVIEGIDGSGKGTQAEMLKRFLNQNGFNLFSDRFQKNQQVSLLEEYFEERGFNVETDDYPRYKDSVWGALIGRMLVGEFGPPSQISPYLSCLPYMLDEYFGGKRIERWVKSGRVVVSNRYFTSNVHQVAKLSGEAQEKFREWLWRTGWEELGICKPDLVIVLRVDPIIAEKLIRNKIKREYMEKQEADLVEKDIAHQYAAAKEYDRMCKEIDWWVAVDCCRDGEIKSVEEVHQDIMKLLEGKGVV
ncbi:MAG: hypothetical protein WC686_05065 [Candidatus Shapirobacteria bacterium]|jgi:dTMP kinase